ncbi:hypothetical protein BFP78_10300 [Gaetbulibacter sp. 5U11]|nr:hypothetical protein BFP78_10300 [Gaetbulibacter sp. 5U11]
MRDFSNLIIRWTFGETEERSTSLQSFDMLDCSLSFASLIFPNAKMYIVYNSLKSDLTLNKLRKIALGKAGLIESNTKWENKKKNSFWKYVPIRIDSSKYELILDSDVVLWEVPDIINKWLNSDGVLINTDWNGRNYGSFEKDIPENFTFNAGILGFPPQYSFVLPDLSLLEEVFLSEQGFVSKEFINSNREMFVIQKLDVFQSNSEEFIDNKVNDILKKHKGAHFCGCNYCHFSHWDKYYKDDIWKYYFSLIK